MATDVASNSSTQRGRRSIFQDRARALLRAKGRRMTQQRVVLLDVIEAAPGHMDADELYRLARERDPRMSLSTVYRTLLVLKEHGLIDELHLSEEHHHYEVKKGEEHYHVVCRRCGAIEEFESEITDQLSSNLLAQIGFAVESVDLDVSGRCARCRTAA